MRGFLLFLFIISFSLDVYAECHGRDGFECQSAGAPGCQSDGLGEGGSTPCGADYYCPENKAAVQCPDGWGTNDKYACDSVTDCRRKVFCPDSNSNCFLFCNDEDCRNPVLKCEVNGGFTVDHNYYITDIHSI